MTSEVVQELERHGLSYELLPHHRTTTAGEEAVALGVPRAEVAKTVVLATEDGYLRAVVPASERLDLHKVRDFLDGGRTTRLATEDDLAEVYPMFELGAVPPFGGPAGDAVLVDRRLAAEESVVLEAGSHRDSVRLRMRDLLALTGARIADITVE